MPPRRGRPVRNVQGVNENPVDPLQRIADLLAGAMRGDNPRMAQPDPNPQSNYLVNFKDFKAVGPPEFKGTTNPIEAQTWIMEIEKVFDVFRVSEEQKTAFAAFMLKGEASY